MHFSKQGQGACKGTSQRNFRVNKDYSSRLPRVREATDKSSFLSLLDCGTVHGLQAGNIRFDTQKWMGIFCFCLSNSHLESKPGPTVKLQVEDFFNFISTVLYCFSQIPPGLENRPNSIQIETLFSFYYYRNL